MLTRDQSSLPQASNMERYPKWKTQQVCMYRSKIKVFGMADVFLHSSGPGGSRKTACSFYPIPLHHPVVSHYCLQKTLSTEIQRISILRTRQQACHKRQHLSLHSREYKRTFGPSWNVLIHHHVCTLRGTHIFCMSVHFQGVGRRKCLDEQRNSHLCHDGASGIPGGTGKNLTIHQTDFTTKQAANVPTGTRRFPSSHKQKSAAAALSQAGETFLWFGRLDSDHSDTLQVLAATNCSAPSKAWDGNGRHVELARRRRGSRANRLAVQLSNKKTELEMWDSIFSCFLELWCIWSSDNVSLGHLIIYVTIFKCTWQCCFETSSYILLCLNMRDI